MVKKAEGTPIKIMNDASQRIEPAEPPINTTAVMIRTMAATTCETAEVKTLLERQTKSVMIRNIAAKSTGEVKTHRERAAAKTRSMSFACSLEAPAPHRR